MTLADRLIVMNAGVVGADLTSPMAIYECPASVFVAGFIGSPQINVLPATVAPDGAGLVLAGGQAVPLAAPLPAAGTPVLVGVRPEYLSAGPGGDRDRGPRRRDPRRRRLCPRPRCRRRRAGGRPAARQRAACGREPPHRPPRGRDLRPPLRPRLRPSPRPLRRGREGSP